MRTSAIAYMELGLDKKRKGVWQYVTCMWFNNAYRKIDGRYRTEFETRVFPYVDEMYRVDSEEGIQSLEGYRTMAEGRELNFHLMGVVNSAGNVWSGPGYLGVFVWKGLGYGEGASRNTVTAYSMGREDSARVVEMARRMMWVRIGGGEKVYIYPE
jgi:hypothetical protein